VVFIQNQIAKILLERYDAIYKYSTGTHAFFKKDHIVICLPAKGKVHYKHLQAIVTKQLNLNIEEFRETLEKLIMVHS